MKIEGILFTILCVFFGLISVIYWVLSQEPVGTTALVLSTGLAFLVGFYLLFTGRRVSARPEDDFHAEVADGAGEYGFFSPHSWWPLPVAFFAAVTGTGLIVGWWLFYLGIVGLMVSVYGFVFEYYRGEHVEA